MPSIRASNKLFVRLATKKKWPLASLRDAYDNFYRFGSGTGRMTFEKFADVFARTAKEKLTHRQIGLTENIDAQKVRRLARFFGFRTGTASARNISKGTSKNLNEAVPN